MRVKIVRSSRGISARESYSDPLSLLQTTPNPHSHLRSFPITCQKKPPGSGTVQFKAPGKDGKSPRGFPLGGKKPTGTFQLTGTASLRSRPKARDPNTVLVVGATGRLGSRIIRELVNSGFRVRAGCRDLEQGQRDFEFVKKFELVSPEALKNLTLVEMDITDEDSIAAGLGNAGKVVFAAGAAEGDLSKSDRIDKDGCISLINLSVESGVQQFILVSSLGTGKIGFPASFLNLFYGILSNKRRAEEVLEASGLPYTIVRPGGMERPTDAYKETHNVLLDTRDKRFGGQVSRLQVAELISACCSSPSLAANKVLEVVAETTAEPLSYEELLEAAPEEITREEQLKKVDEKEKLTQEIAGLVQKVTGIEEQTIDARERKEALEEKLKELKGVQKGAITEASKVIKKAAQIEKQLTTLKGTLSAKEQEESVAKALYQAAQKVSREGRWLTKEEQQEIKFAVLNPEIAKQREEEAAKARKEAEEKERAEAKAKAEQEAKAKKEAEEKTRAEAKAKAKEEAKAKKEAEEKARVEAKAKADEEARARKEAEEKAQAEAKEKAEAEEKARAEAKAKAEEEAKAKREAEEKAKAEAKAIQEAEAKAKQEAEEKARIEAEAKAKKEAEEKAEAEAKAKQEAEAKAKAEAEEKAKAEAKAKQEAEAKAKQEAEERARIEAEEKAKARAEAAEKAKAAEAARLAEKQKAAAEAKAKQEALRKSKAAAKGNGTGTGFFNTWKAPWSKFAQVEKTPAQLEAKAWIDAWKTKQANQNQLPEAKEWIESWKKNQNAAEELLHAKEWIQQWKSSIERRE